jgi:Na+/H+-dicarboxylate symporter
MITTLKKVAQSYLKISLSTRLLVAFVFGCLVGLAFTKYVALLQPLGEVLTRSLKLLALPLVIVTILKGLSQTSLASFSRAATRTLVLQIASTVAAIFISLAFALWLQPGVDFDANQIANTEATPVTKPSSLSVKNFFINLIPDNLVAAFVNGDVLAIALFTILIALAIAQLRRRGGDEALQTFDHLLEVADRGIKLLLKWLMEYAPFGVLALTAIAVAQYRDGVFVQFIKVILTVYAAQLSIAALCFAAIALSQIRLLHFWESIKDCLLTAFATGSSAAVFPLEVVAIKEHLNVNQSVADFALPVGLALHKLGSAAHLLVMTLFVANMAGATFTSTQYVMAALLALLGAISTPPISGGAYVVLGFILEQLGLPLQIIGLLIGMPLLGKLSTPVNSLGRLTVTAIVAGEPSPVDSTLSSQQLVSEVNSGQ